MSIRTSSAALAVARRQTQNEPGTCQYNVRTWFLAPSAGDRDKDGDADAVDGWLSEPKSARHFGDRNPPPGKPLAFKGGRNGFGHRALSDVNSVISTDMLDNRYSAGHTSKVTGISVSDAIAKIERSMGVTYVGWSDTIDGYPIPKEAEVPSPTGPTIDHLHTSGRFDRSPQSVKDDLEIWLRDGEVDLITATEFKGNRRRDVIANLPGWDLYNGVEKPGADDVLVAWKESRFELVKKQSTVVSTKKSYRTNGSLIPPQRVTDVLLLDKRTHRTLYVSVSHLSSHVEVAGGIRNSLRGAVWRESTRNWAKHQRQIQKQWRPSGRLLVADWNVNWKKLWFRNYIHLILPAFRSGWRKPWPARGTLGDRLIDIALFNWRRLALVKKAWVLTRHESSDHRAFREVLRWR